MICCILTVNTERNKGKFANMSWLLSRPSLSSSLPFTPSLHPSTPVPLLHLAKLRCSCFLLLHLCLTSPAPSLPTGGCAGGVCVCVEKGGEGEVSQWCNLVFKINLSNDLKAKNETNWNIDVPVRDYMQRNKTKTKGWCDEMETFYLKAATQLKYCLPACRLFCLGARLQTSICVQL